MCLDYSDSIFIDKEIDTVVCRAMKRYRVIRKICRPMHMQRAFDVIYSLCETICTAHHTHRTIQIQEANDAWKN